MKKTKQPIFTNTWFVNTQKEWDAKKDFFYNIPNKRCLEIGAFEGQSTYYLAKNYCNGQGSIIDSIDTWIGSVEHKPEEITNLYDRFTYNLADEINSGRVTPHQGYSQNILLKFLQEVKSGLREKYDFIYVDASHIARDVLMDAILSWDMLKNGGFMYFDDYQWNHFKIPTLAPKLAIDSFLNVYRGAYNIKHKGYQVHIEKICDYPENRLNLEDQKIDVLGDST